MRHPYARSIRKKLRKLVGLAYERELSGAKRIGKPLKLILNYTCNNPRIIWPWKGRRWISFIPALASISVICFSEYDWPAGVAKSILREKSAGKRGPSIVL